MSQNHEYTITNQQLLSLTIFYQLPHKNLYQLSASGLSCFPHILKLIS